MQQCDLRGVTLTRSVLAQHLPRARVDVAAALASVLPVIDQVRTGGAAAISDLCERFDGVRPPQLRVPQPVIDAALDRLSEPVRHAMEHAIEHLSAGHLAQCPTEREIEIVPGGYIRQRWIPVHRVGLYAPGGLAVYPSSVIHNAMAARTAGVESLALASPPQAAYGGYPHPTILAASKLLDIREVYAVGGAQAIAMFAYGYDPTPAPRTVRDAPLAAAVADSGCEPVDVITGPGNIYVAAAKRAVQGRVGIDAEAGPTEIAIIADDSANAEYVAADLISQAEHDPAAACVLITPSEELANRCISHIEHQLSQTEHHQRVECALNGSQSAIVLVDDLQAAIAVANAYAAEHLEIHTQSPREVVPHIRNAGAIFLGEHSPVPLGDYLAGSNHVLPTGGTARFTAGLNVMTYLKPVQVIDYSAPALGHVSHDICALAYAEDLPAHAQAIRIRMRSGEENAG
ncbi:histidinol dehydrogenase [Trueperella sp. LYQ143]|uniref:histidinol dehydrogenase n=1 Tax=Trueperella sp. LYQ143 TaxID=3391059 RepID=UPI003983BA22